MRKYLQYYFKDGEQLTARKLNLRFEDLDLRIHKLEEVKINWEEAVSLVKEYGLSRINEAVIPLIDTLETQASELITNLRTELNNLSAWKISVESNVSDLQTKVENLQSNKAEKDLSNITSLGNLLNLGGTGSGLDADLLDGKHYTDILNDITQSLSSHNQAPDSHPDIRKRTMILAMFL